MTRIRYENDLITTHLLVSKKVFLLRNGVTVRVTIDPIEKEYQLVDTNRGELVLSAKEGNKADLFKLKKAVRETLLELGVNLQNEVKKSKKEVA